MIRFPFLVVICYGRSEEVEHKLEQECGQVYSPVRNYKYFQQQPASKHPGGDDDDEQQRPKQHSFKYQSQPAQVQAPQISQAHIIQQEQANKETGKEYIPMERFRLSN